MSLLTDHDIYKQAKEDTERLNGVHPWTQEDHKRYENARLIINKYEFDYGMPGERTPGETRMYQASNGTWITPGYDEVKTVWSSIATYDGTTHIDYKFNEANLIKEIQKYIDHTYDQHYNTSKLQAFEEIVDAGYGCGFAMGNVTKYNKRYGKKAGFNRDDLLKMIHYSILALYVHDIEQGDNEETKS